MERKDVLLKNSPVGEVWVSRYNIIGTHRWIYDVYLAGGLLGGKGGTFKSVNDLRGVDLEECSSRWYVRLGTQGLPDDIDALPAWSYERSSAVDAWRQRQEAIAYGIIEVVFPETILHGERRGGEIVLEDPDGLF